MSEENHPSSPLPPTLNHIIGQKRVVEQAQIALDSVMQDNESYPATLLLGPPGVGKTMLAVAIALEMAAGFQEILGQSLISPSDLHAVLLAATDKSVVFVDECDEMGPWL